MPIVMHRICWIPLFLSLPCFAQAGLKTRNVVLVMTDGLRWQELFGGAEETLISKDLGAVSNVDETKRAFWRDSTASRRETLLPFLWSVVARQGQIFGNRSLGSDAFVLNGLNFSYPGYSETLCGFADPRIRSNDNVPNPNVTLLEWLNARPAYRGKVAAFGAWEVITAIVNAKRGEFYANSGYEPAEFAPSNERMKLLNRLKFESRYFESEPFDSFTFHTAMEYLKLRKPRVMFLSLGETDEFAHAGQYDKYLHSARRVDAYLKELWESLQSMPEYRGTTTLIFVPDHGRGEAPVGWKNHGEKVPDSKYIWMAFLGPDTPALGERSKIDAVTQSQIAATIAALLGEDYAGAVPKAGKPLMGVIRK